MGPLPHHHTALLSQLLSQEFEASLTGGLHPVPVRPPLPHGHFSPGEADLRAQLDVANRRNQELLDMADRLMDGRRADRLASSTSPPTRTPHPAGLPSNHPAAPGMGLSPTVVPPTMPTPALPPPPGPLLMDEHQRMRAELENVQKDLARLHTDRNVEARKFREKLESEAAAAHRARQEVFRCIVV